MDELKRCTTSQIIIRNSGLILFLLRDIVQYSWVSWNIGEESWRSATCRNISPLCKSQAASIANIIYRNEEGRRRIETQKLDTTAYGISLGKPVIFLNTELIRCLLSLRSEMNCTVLNCCKIELTEMFSCNCPTYTLHADFDAQFRNF